MGFVIQLAWAIFFTVLAELLRPKQRPEVPQPSSLDDFDLPTADDGRAVQVVFGRCKVDGPNVTWYGDLAIDPIKKNVKTGMFSSDKITIGYKYYLGVELFTGYGPIDNLVEIRFGDKVPAGTRSETSDYVLFMYDAPNLFGGDEKEGGISGVVKFFKGTQNQVASNYLQTVRNKSLPAYLGFSYCVLERLYVGTSAYIKPISFIIDRYPNQLGLTGNKHKIGTDANPACMIYEILTDSRWGASIPVGLIDITGLRAIGNTLHAEGLGLSMLLNATSTARNAIDEILRHIDGVMRTDPTTGLISFKLARDDYDVESLPVFGPSEISDVKISRISWDETKNTIKVKYVSQAENFTERSLQVQDLANITARGGIVDTETLQFLGFSKPENAAFAAARALKTLAYPLAKITVTMNRKGWQLAPGSVFRLNWPPHGFDNVVVRVIAGDYGDSRSAQMQFEVVEDIFAVGSNVYTVPAPSGWTDPATVPLPVAAQYAFEAPYEMVLEEQRYGLVCAARANGIDEGYAIYHDPDGGTAYVQSNTSSEFTPTGLLTAEYSADTPATHTAGFTIGTCTDMRWLEGVDDATWHGGGSLLLVKSAAGEELMAWKTVTDNNDGTYTIGSVIRGVYDTVPLSHPAGSRVWFVSAGKSVISPTPYPDNGSVTGKLLPYNSQNMVALGDATAFTVTLSERARKPYPPANFKVNGDSYPESIIGNATLAWAIRSRLVQAAAGQVVAQDAASVTGTPEGAYTVRVYVGGVLVRELTTGTGYVLAITNPNASSAMSGWTVTLGSFTSANSGTLSPNGGNYFSPGTSAESRMQQTLVLANSGVPDDTVDSGDATFSVSWYQRSYGQTPYDTGQVTLDFIDEGGSILLSVSSPLQSPPAPSGGFSWDRYGLSSLIPTTTRSVRITARAVRNTGTNNDACFDGFEASIAYQAAATAYTYTAAARLADSTNGALAVEIGVTAVSGAYSSIERRTPPFIMSGLGMTLGTHLGGNAA